MLSTVSWFDILNFLAATITVIGGFNFLFSKAANSFKQQIAKLNRRLRFHRIGKLRGQYFMFKSIDNDNKLLISYCARNIGLVVLMTMLMCFTGFTFLYLEQGLYKLVGGFYMLGILSLTFYHFDDFGTVINGFKSPNKFLKKNRSDLKELRIKGKE
ncbi:hypothetical protein AB4298_04750 [Shewanella sp. 10N.261.52.F9]|uniref:hypothetical protein n=1 Tax=Shewanella sp. 10N.261.52.F9 TaxID=3229684 RepID=UPI0035527F6C